MSRGGNVSWVRGPGNGRVDEAEWDLWAACHEDRNISPCLPPKGVVHADAVQQGWIHIIDGCPACAEAASVLAASQSPPSQPALQPSFPSPLQPEAPRFMSGAAPAIASTLSAMEEHALAQKMQRQAQLETQAQAQQAQAQAQQAQARAQAQKQQAQVRPAQARWQPTPLLPQPPQQWQPPPQPMAQQQWQPPLQPVPPSTQLQVVAEASEFGSIPLSSIAMDGTPPTLLSFCSAYSAQLRTASGAGERVTVRAYSACSGDMSSLCAEADALREVCHPFLARVFGTCARASTGGGGHQLLIVRQWAPRTLADASRCVHGGANRALTLWHLQALHAAALGLSSLHERPGGGLIHGDMRALNVLLGDSSATLADFGLARLHRTLERSGLVRSGGMERSTQWRAPELFSRTRVLSVATDVYAFGITMHEVLSGLSDPFEGAYGPPPRDLIALVCAAIDPLRPRLDALPVDTPQAVYDVMQRCWAAEPSVRPTMAEVAFVLSGACASLGMGDIARAADAAHLGAQAEERARSRGSRAPESQGSQASWGSWLRGPAAPITTLALIVDEDDMPLAQAAAAAAYTRAAAPATGPRVTLTPVRDVDPPIWTPPDVHLPGCIPAGLESLLLHFPPAVRANIVCPVTVPFYTEDGFALRRTLEALALQAADLRTAATVLQGMPQHALPELHVFGYADGWAKDDGTPILSSSMFAELLDVFGPSLDVDALLDMLEGEGSSSNASVLIQYAVDAAGPHRPLVLAPLQIDCSWALGMTARAHTPDGIVSTALNLQSLARERGKSSASQTVTGRTPLLSKVWEGASQTVTGANEPLTEMQPLYFTLMIKRRNAKKHHSHRWFMEAMAPITRLRAGPRCEFVFCTDAGTLYAPFCLAELMQHMHDHPVAAAVTGHQRIMHKEDQLDPMHGRAESLEAACLRSVQSFDFESGLCVFNGMHALAGFLPVVPGPCGLFRISALTPQIIDRVRDIVTSPAEEDGLVVANLKIAEDRILSYLLVLMEGGGDGTRTWQTHWVPSTTFFFESEATLKEFVLQRRRWLNGTIAGYLYILSEPSLWRGVARCRSTACSVLFLSCLQLVVFGIVMVSPGMMMTTAYLAVAATLDVMHINAGHCVSVEVNPCSAYVSPVAIVFITIGAASFVAHVFCARTSGTFVSWSWWARVALNAATMALVTTLGVVMLFVTFVAPGAFSDFTPSTIADARVAICVGIVYTTTPYFLASLHSPDSLIAMVRCTPTFMLFQPTILGDLLAYAIARTDDVSWGTKAVPGSARTGVSGAAERASTRAQTRRAESQAAAGLPHTTSRRAALAATLRTSRARESSANLTTCVSIAQTLACLIVAGINVAAVVYKVPHYLLVLGLGLSSIGFCIMLASMLFFCARNTCGANASVARGANAGVVVGGWVIVCIAVAVIAGAPPQSPPYWAACTAFVVTYAVLIAASARHVLCGGGRR